MAETSPATINDPFSGLVGESAAMHGLRQSIVRIAPTDATVLVIGESGTGKEDVAQTIHRLSRRSQKIFLPVNCSAIAPTLIEAELLGHEKGSFTGADRRRTGYFERADGGTIFLDEVTEIPLDMQVKLLRVLEARHFQRVGGTELIKVDVRVIAATNRDIQIEVREGRFREDLMYRLAVVPLRVPPLRERGGDVELLAKHFLAELNRREGGCKRLSRRYLTQLQSRTWTGNVRELKNAVSRAYILADEVLDVAANSGAPLQPVLKDGMLELKVGTQLADAQRELIIATLDSCNGDKKRAAQTLGVSLKTLYNRLDIYLHDDPLAAERD